MSNGSDIKKVRRCIVSVTDKSGVVDFVRELEGMGVEVISTGGTAKALSDGGINVVAIGDYTGFPEMLDGRVKTLHPRIAGGILGMRGNPDHISQMEAADIPPIDMVIVNLYAFEKTIAGGASFEDAIENIDIGGPSMIRAAAKNWNDVACVTDINDYSAIIEEMRGNDGGLSSSTRLGLAKKVYQLTARYDGAISNYLGTLDNSGEVSEEDGKFPETYTVQYKKLQGMRYGENPHQGAAFYGDSGAEATGLAAAKILHGKAMSYNNVLDVSAAIELACDFAEPAAVIVKHNNPCGTAISKEGLIKAYELAFETDTSSAFGGIVSFNRRVTADVAEAMRSLFVECVVAPGYDDEALEIYKKKKNLRIVDTVNPLPRVEGIEIKRVPGGALLQDLDTMCASDLKVATKREPTDEELADLLFAWKVCKHVKSNAIILASGGRTVGIGAGQMSRIDSTRIAVQKAGNAGIEVKGSVLASDAFFPFRDNVDMAAEYGVKAIVQPGGSIRDDEVIAAADEHGIAMVFTAERHFRH